MSERRSGGYKRVAQKQPIVRPRKQKDTSTSAPPPPSPQSPHGEASFFTPLHEQRYYGTMQGKKICKERALELKQGEHPDIYNTMCRRGWKNYCTLFKTSKADICREFFANAYKADKESVRTYTSMVRGTEILYDPLSLQQVLRTSFDRRGQVQCSFQRKWRLIKYGDGDVFEKLQPILDCIAAEGTTWDLGRNQTPLKTYVGELTPAAKIWFHFIVCSIMPSTNHSDVGLERAVLLWAILTAEPVDLCQILADSIYDMAQEGAKASIGHSSLIQYLCLNAGVDIPTTGLTVDVFPPITVRWIIKNCGVAAGEEVTVAPAGPRRQRAPAQRRERVGPSRSMEDRLTSIEGTVQHIVQEAEFAR